MLDVISQCFWITRKNLQVSNITTEFQESTKAGMFMQKCTRGESNLSVLKSILGLNQTEQIKININSIRRHGCQEKGAGGQGFPGF